MKFHPSYTCNTKCLAIVATALLISLGSARIPHAFASSIQAAPSCSVQKIKEEILTSGATLTKYDYTTTRSTTTVHTLANVIQVDLQNPHVKLDVFIGGHSKLDQKQTTGEMAKYQRAVAAVNGDFFSMNAKEKLPMGGCAAMGEIIASPTKMLDWPMLTVTDDRIATIDRYEFTGTVTAPDGASIGIHNVNRPNYYTVKGSTNKTFVPQLYLYTPTWVPQLSPDQFPADAVEIILQDGIVTSVHQPITGATAPAGGYVLLAYGASSQWIQQHVQPGQPLTIDQALHPKSSSNPIDPTQVQVMIGGSDIILSEGKSIALTPKGGLGGSRARTAVGYSQDGRYLYMITAEKHAHSSGMTLPELQSFLASIGVWKGMNMDGGGSTTMVARPLGDDQVTLAHPTETGQKQRYVVNALGVLSTAPAGTLAGFQVYGPRTLLKGQQATYTIKPYDTYYNPFSPLNVQPIWHTNNSNVIRVDQNTIKALSPGKATITVEASGSTTPVELTVTSDTDAIALAPPQNLDNFELGTKVAVPFTVTLRDGTTTQLQAGALKWQYIGCDADIQDDKLIVHHVHPNVPYAYAIATYGDLSTVLALTACTNTPQSTDAQTITMTVGQKHMTVGGKKQTLAVAPTMKDRQVYVPIKPLLQQLGGHVFIDKKAKRLILLHKDNVVVLLPNANEYVVAGERRTTSTPTYVSSQPSLVSLHTILGSLGFTVTEDKRKQKITIRHVTK